MWQQSNDRDARLTQNRIEFKARTQASPITPSSHHLTEIVTEEPVKLLPAPTFNHYLISGFRTLRCVRSHPSHSTSSDEKSRHGSASLTLPIFTAHAAGPASPNLTKSFSPSREAVTHPSSHNHARNSHESQNPYLVVGLFNRVDGNPQEQLIELSNPTYLFWQLFWAIARLRGLGAILSLKDVKYFSIFTCDSATGSHVQQLLDHETEASLHSLLTAYNSWHSWEWRNKDAVELNVKWTEWIHGALNHGSHARSSVVEHQSYSLEIVLGWSPRRIAIVVFSPVVLSLVVGLVLNSRDWADEGNCEMSWVVATYIATSGGSEY